MSDDDKVKRPGYQPLILSLIGICTAGIAFYYVYKSLKEQIPPKLVDAVDLEEKKISYCINNTYPVLLIQNTIPAYENNGSRTIVLSKGKYHGQTKTIIFTRKLAKDDHLNNITICSKFLHIPGEINSPDSYYNIDMKYEGQSVNLIWLKLRTTFVDEHDCPITLEKWYLQSASNCEITGGHNYVITT